MLSNHMIMLLSMMAAVVAALIMMEYLGVRAHKGRGNDTPSGEGESAPLTQVDWLFDRSAARLEREIHALSRRGNLNLTIGVITTGFAVGLLAYMVMNEDAPTDDVAAVLAHYIPRVTTVSFIEVFSYFFLRLYRSSLSEIKFYQNELTCLASHQIALDASRSVDPATTRSVLEMIARHNPNSAPADSCKLTADSSSDPRHKLAVDLFDRMYTLASMTAKAK